MQLVDEPLYRRLCDEAAASPRKRAHHLLHGSHDEPVQRMAVAMHRGTYIRPHRHRPPQLWEQFCIHRGSAVALQFDDAGEVTGRVEIDAGEGPYLIEIDAGCWHTLTALEDNSLLSEYKQGPFQPVEDADWVDWGPAEGKPGAEAVASWFLTAQKGDVFSTFD